MKVAFLMNDFDPSKLLTNSSMLLIQEAIKRKHRAFVTTQEQLTLYNTIVKATVHAVNSNIELENEELALDLTQFDLILIRQDPPFDTRYLTSTHILDIIANKVPIVNNPAMIRNYPEKFFTTQFPDLTLPTLITEDINDIVEFYHQHKPIILKPLYSFGGMDILYIDNITNLTSGARLIIEKHKDAIIAQKFCDKVRDGTKRVALLAGKVVACIKKIPQKGDIRTQITYGNRETMVELTDTEDKICNIIGERLAEIGIMFADVDLIDIYLTEINITSPASMRSARDACNINLAAKYWDILEERYG